MRGADPLKTHGNPINQVRTNDFVGGIWQMREFNLMSKTDAESIHEETKLKVDADFESIKVGLWTATTSKTQ